MFLDHAIGYLLSFMRMAPRGPYPLDAPVVDPTDSWLWWSSTRLAGSVYEPLSKKRPQAVAEEIVGDSAHSQRRVCLCHGGRAGGLHPPLRPATAGRVSGCGEQATIGGNAGANPRCPRAAGAGR